MSTNTTVPWETLERRRSALFFLASAVLLGTALWRGSAYLFDGVAFGGPLGTVMLLGRLAAILGTGGLTVQLVRRSSRQGRVTRAVVSLAVVFTVGLFSLALLENFGVSTPVIAVFGLGTVTLSVLSYLVTGRAILKSGAYTGAVGWLLVAAAATLLVIFVGLRFLPTGVIGPPGEATMAVLYFLTGARLRSEQPPTQ